MDRKILKLPFSPGNPPDWICPSCGKAPLRIRKGTFLKEERAGTRDHSHQAWEPEWIAYTYSCVLECANDACKEFVASGGTGAVEEDVGLDRDGEPELLYEDSFRPKFFIPHLKLLKIPEKCPEAVSKPIEESFSLFFASPGAASNAIRTAVEAILTDLKIRRFERSGGKLRFVSLHRRISLLPPRYAELKEILLAIKWLGNAGSHDSVTAITQDDVLDSYEFMEHALVELYAPKAKELKRLAKKVNRKRGPVR